jgi:hypothetical protein
LYETCRYITQSCDMNIGLHPEQDTSTLHHHILVLQDQV